MVIRKRRHHTSIGDRTAIAYLMDEKNDITKGEDVVLNLSGRGDKDINTVADSLGIKI